VSLLLQAHGQPRDLLPPLTAPPNLSFERFALTTPASSFRSNVSVSFGLASRPGLRTPTHRFSHLL